MAYVDELTASVFFIGDSGRRARVLVAVYTSATERDGEKFKFFFLTISFVMTISFS